MVALLAWRSNMKFSILPTMALSLSAVSFSVPVFSAPVGLDFGGGCPESYQNSTCMPGGNATVENVADVLGVAESLVSEVTTGFSYTGTGTSGTWTVTDPSITHLAFKADGFFILGERTALNGDWSTDPADWDLTLATCPIEICSAGARAYVDADFMNNGSQIAAISNVRAYSVVPVPAAAWLFGSGLLGLAGIAKRKKA
jgi:hypothetical protein